MSAVLSLHDIGEAQDILDSLLVESEGELTPEIADLWEQLSGQTDEKIERWGLWLRGQTLQAELIKAEEERLTARRKAIENAVKRGKDGLQFHMKRLGRDTVKGKLLTVALANNPPSVKGEVDAAALWGDEDNAFRALIKYVPESFVLDRRAVLDAFKAGQPIPAGLTVEQGQSLRIR